MRVEISTVIAADADMVWRHVKTPRLLEYVAGPLIKFVPKNPANFPELWATGQYKTTMKFFGFIPIGRQTIGIEYPEPPTRGTHQLRDNGNGSLISQWDHMITISERQDGHTDYCDRVDISAGLLTPFIALFAWVFYRHRQRRWHRLAADSFTY
jgi:hypothetical protein